MKKFLSSFQFFINYHVCADCGNDDYDAHHHNLLPMDLLRAKIQNRGHVEDVQRENVTLADARDVLGDDYAMDVPPATMVQALQNEIDAANIRPPKQ